MKDAHIQFITEGEKKKCNSVPRMAEATVIPRQHTGFENGAPEPTPSKRE
jgi:hypothetical protein